MQMLNMDDFRCPRSVRLPRFSERSRSSRLSVSTYGKSGQNKKYCKYIKSKHLSVDSGIAGP